jgi:hypothetical protein
VTVDPGRRWTAQTSKTRGRTLTDDRSSRGFADGAGGGHVPRFPAGANWDLEALTAEELADVRAPLEPDPNLPARGSCMSWLAPTRSDRPRSS